jgi:transglutaminase-like putative cysteine protease
LNEKGKRSATGVVFYDKLRKVNFFRGNVYDAQGNLIRKMKNSDVKDESAVSGFYEDDRVKFADLSDNTYPYTVEFEYEIEFKFLFWIPDWSVLPGQDASVQYSEFSLVYPSNLVPRYKVLNTPDIVEKGKTAGGLLSYSWKYKNLKPMKLEPMGPSGPEIKPTILAAPTEFQYEAYAGKMDSWQAYGQWIKSLNKDRDILPEETRQRVLELTKGKATVEEKVKALYEFLQNKTRYVSIQLGIGGHQPFEASLVDKTGYGDCKALSNYMIALLKVAGIPANYVLIAAGREEADIDTSFPSTQFNHVTVAVPVKKDTIWLECTSQTNPFGYQGDFTGDRHALMITDQGASVVRTISYPAEVNTQMRKAEVTIEKTGDAEVKVISTYAGLQYETNGLYFYVDKSYDDQKKWIYENSGIGNFEMGQFKVSAKKDKIPQATIELDITIRRFASLSGKRLFLTPNLMNRSTFIPKKVENRTAEVIQPKSFVDSDTILIHIPDNLYPEFLPEPIHYKSRFGEYECTVKVEQGLIVYVRKMSMKKGRFQADSYNELIEFYKNVSKADNMKLVFLNKT